MAPGSPLWFDLIGFGAGGWGFALLRATGVTIALACAGFALGLVLGGAVAWARLSGRRGLAAAARLYSTVIRGVPELLVLYLLFFGGSAAIMTATRLFAGEGFVGAPAFLTGMLALALICAAYCSEVLRGAWNAVDAGQAEAAEALGLRPFAVLLAVTGPQVMRHALPGLGNVWQLTLKESALVSLAGVTELMRQSAVAANATSKPFLFYATAAGLYLLVTTASTAAMHRAERTSKAGERTA